MLKILVIALSLVSFRAFAADVEPAIDPQPTCELNVPAQQQEVYKAFNAFAESNSEADGLIWIGALLQYSADIQALVDQNDPNVGNDNYVGLESSSGYLCANKGMQKWEERARLGNRVAIEMYLMYSAAYQEDGAGAEDLGEIQQVILDKYPKTVKWVENKYASFFKAHPIQWFNED